MRPGKSQADAHLRMHPPDFSYEARVSLVYFCQAFTPEAIFCAFVRMKA
jgi:hypothetical protein